MDRDRAKSILKHIKDMDSPFAELNKLLSDVPDEVERKNYLKRLGEVFGIIYTEIMFPIIREYPDLDPDKSQLNKVTKKIPGSRAK